MDNSPFKEPVAHKLPLSDEVLKNLAVHHLARRIIVKCTGCPFDYALTVPEEIWFSGQTDFYRESLIGYLKTTECGRHPSHIVWTHGLPIAAGQLRSATELGKAGETDSVAENSQPAREKPLAKISASVDHVYLAVKCTGWACDNWIILCDMGASDAGKEHKRKLPSRFDVTCPACNSVLTYTVSYEHKNRRGTGSTQPSLPNSSLSKQKPVSRPLTGWVEPGLRIAATATP